MFRLRRGAAIQGSMMRLQGCCSARRWCAVDSKGRFTIGAAIRNAVVPERSIMSAVFWRTIRTTRLALLATTIYGAGKSAGHVEVLEDPDGVAKQMVVSVIVGTHQSEDGKETKAGYHKRNSPLRQRVERVGVRVLHAAREEVDARLAALPAAVGGSEDPHAAERQQLNEAKKRLGGKWHWVVTSSAMVKYVPGPLPCRTASQCTLLAQAAREHAAALAGPQSAPRRCSGVAAAPLSRPCVRGESS